MQTFPVVNIQNFSTDLVTESVTAWAADTEEILVMNVSTVATEQSELREMVLCKTDKRGIPVYREECTPERRRPRIISPGALQQIEMSNNQWNCVDYCFGVCGKADSVNRSGTGSCWNCCCLIVWGYRVSCLVAIVIEDRLYGIHLFTEDRRVFTRGPGLVGNPVTPCDVIRVYTKMNEITINWIVGFQWDDPGTDVEDEMPAPALSPVQNVAPVIPPTETEDSLDRGDGFDLDLARVMLDVSVMPALISPIEESEVPPTSKAAEYAAPATPVLETVIESPGYTVPEELTFTWVPGYVPVPEAVAVDEERQTLSPEHPPPNTVPASAATPVVSLVTMEQFIPTMPSPPEDMMQVARTESVRQTDRAKVFVVEAAEGSPSTVMCQDDQDIGPDLTREGPFDVCEVEPEPGQSSLVLNSMPGCQFRMTSYDDRDSRDDLDPAYGIHLHDPRMMEYMGAPESARLLGR